MIIAFCVNTKNDAVLDPTCGTGTFLIRSYDRLKTLGTTRHQQLLAQIWGVDIAHFPAELATINLYRKNIEDYANFPHIIARDFFEVLPGHIHEFPAPKPGKGDKAIKVPMPQFQAAVGNFPFIRQLLIERQVPGYKQQIAQVLSNEWRKDYPDLFSNGDLKLSGQADIYAYMFFHTAAHVQDGGRLGFITSNSWLNTSYGYELQKFFLKNFRLIAIIESRSEAWFSDAAVNTIVTVLEKCKSKEARDATPTRFIQIKTPLAEAIPWEIQQADKRWGGLDKLVSQIDSLPAPAAGEILTYEDSTQRVRSRRQGDLLSELEGTGRTAKWGVFLRAPRVFFEMTKRLLASFTQLQEVAAIRRGYTAGINEFFYVSRETIEHWQIEPQFLKPVIRSPKEVSSIKLATGDVSHKILLCQTDKATLRKMKCLGILRYIRWGESRSTKEGKKWPEVPSVSGRPLWYNLGVREPGTILLQMITNDRFFAVYNPKHIHVDHNLFEVFPNDSADERGLLVYLNSTVFALIREVGSRVNLGDGAAKTEGIDWEQMPVPDSPTLKKLGAHWHLLERIMNRAMQPIAIEVRRPDRQTLDAAVMKTLGIDDQSLQEMLYEGITGLVEERIQLAQSRKRVRIQKVARDIEKLKDQIVEDLFPDGTKRFPDAFVDAKAMTNAEEVSVPDGTLRLGPSFFGRCEVVSDNGQRIELEDEDTAAFIVYSQRPNLHIIRIPASRAAVRRANTLYESYLQRTCKLVEAHIFERTLDHKLSELLTRQILEELGITLARK
ncbi:MAG: N-6 DNA methylase [Candidatus Zixiibacteriota bacterium]